MKTTCQTASAGLHRLVLSAIAAIVVPACLAQAGLKPAEHPFILWTKDDAAAIRKKIDNEPWAKRQYERLIAENKNPIVNLFRFQVMGDQAAGKGERDFLLTFINAPVDVEKRWSDNYLSVLRYDVFYDTLSAEQRKGIEDTFRKHIQYELEHPYVNGRVSLLPNMQLPRLLSAHLMTLALEDEALIRKLWAAPSGFKWFFDEYLSDGGFYNEEFAKMTSLIGELLLYCRGLDRLGLGELGYDFKGSGGATMRSYVESYLRLGYPRTDIPGGLPRYERIAMGDARGHWLGVFQHANVPGYIPRGEPRNEQSIPGVWNLFYAANMNGRDHKDNKVEKLQFPQWFEILQAKYADASFAYFLAQMRRPGEDKYYPTVFWGLDPIDPQAAKPPAAPSGVYPQRGFAMLRADESPAYWESPAPAVAMQFATLYVHYTADCFSLLGYHAFNRPIYFNRAISSGYNGGPWDFSVRGHGGVIVDSEQAQPIGEVPSRSEFSPLVKFASARGVLKDGARGYQGKGEVRSSDQPKEPATDVYTNIDLSRSLFLTREYLFDVYQLADTKGQPRQFHWLVHAPGTLAGDGAWKESHDLQNSLYNIEARKDGQAPERSDKAAADAAQSWVRITGEKKLPLDANPADITVTQTCILPDISKSVLGKAWYDRKIGVRVRLLGEPGTTAFAFDTPVAYPPGTWRAPKEQPDRPETGGVSIAIARRAPATVFVALHEPFENAKPRITEFRRIQQTADGVAAAIVGADAGVNDRVLLQFNPDGKPLTLAGDGESFTFADYAFVRVGAERVEAAGNITAMKIKVSGQPKLVVNGKDRPASFADGYMAMP